MTNLPTPSPKDGTTLAEQLANQLRKAIRQGKYAPGTAIPPERQLAEVTGLSRPTVRKAVELLIDEGLLHRRPGSGTFVGAGPKATLFQDAIGLIVPSLANPYHAELADAVEQAVSARGYQLVVAQSEYSVTSEGEQLLRYAATPAVKGVLTVPNVENVPMEAYRALRDQHTPVGFMARAVDGVEADVVTTDHVSGAREVMRHLIKLGHRRIAYIHSIPEQPTYHLEGYLLGLREAGIPVAPDLIVTPPHIMDRAGLEGVRQLVRSKTTFSAIFARSDLTAMGALQALREAGLRVPDDVSLVGFDNAHAAAFLDPPLTTVDYMVREVGRLSVLFLIERIEGPNDVPSRHVVIQPRLIIRKSSAPPLAETRAAGQGRGGGPQ